MTDELMKFAREKQGEAFRSMCEALGGESENWFATASYYDGKMDAFWDIIDFLKKREKRQ